MLCLCLLSVISYIHLTFWILQDNEFLSLGILLRTTFVFYQLLYGVKMQFLLINVLVYYKIQIALQISASQRKGQSLTDVKFQTRWCNLNIADTLMLPQYFWLIEVAQISLNVVKPHCCQPNKKASRLPLRSKFLLYRNIAT